MSKAAVDDYNPIDHRPPEQITSSTFAVFMHLCKAAIGSGILFLPYAFRKTGYVAAFLCSIFVGTISIHTAILTVKCGQILCRRAKVPSLNFAEVAETSFQLGPESLQKYAKLFYRTTNIIVCFVQYETTIVYSLYVASSFQQIIEYFSGWDMSIRVYIAAFLPIFILFSLVPDFKSLVPYSVVGSFCLLFGFLASFYYLFDDFPSPSRLETFVGLDEVPIYCSVFLFAVHNMSMLMPLENSMREPDKMAFVLKTSMIINVFVNMTFGFLGYNKYMDACDTVIKNLPLDEVRIAADNKATMCLGCNEGGYGIHTLYGVTIIKQRTARFSEVKWERATCSSVWASQSSTSSYYSTYRILVGLIVYILRISQLVKISISLSVLLTYGLQYYIPITILWPMLAEKVGDNPIYEKLFRVGGCLSCTLLAIAVPHLAPLLGLFAAVSMATVMLLIPIMIECATKWNDPGRLQHILMIIKNSFIFCVWLLILILGAMENIKVIIKEYSGEQDEEESEMCN